MKRAEKINLLTKLMHGNNPQIARHLLQQVKDTAPRSLILIDDLDNPDQVMIDDDTVHFTDRGTSYTMTLLEATQYAKRYGVGTLFVLPANHTN